MNIQEIGKNSIIASNVHYFYYDGEFFFQKMKETGWREVELYLGTPHIFIDGNGIDDFLNLPELAHKYGITIKSVHPETISFRYNLCSLDETWNRKSLQCYRFCIDYAAALGAGSLNTGIAGAFRDVDQNRIFEIVTRNLSDLARYSEEKGVALILETESPEYEGFITTLEQMTRLDEQIDSPALCFGLNMDALRAAGETELQWEAQFGERIAYRRFSSVAEYQRWKKVDLQGESDRDDIFYFTGDDCLDKPFEADRLAKEVIYGSD